MYREEGETIDPSEFIHSIKSSNLISCVAFLPSASRGNSQSDGGRRAGGVIAKSVNVRAWLIVKGGQGG